MLSDGREGLEQKERDLHEVALASLNPNMLLSTALAVIASAFCDNLEYWHILALVPYQDTQHMANSTSFQYNLLALLS